MMQFRFSCISAKRSASSIFSSSLTMARTPKRYCSAASCCSSSASFHEDGSQISFFSFPVNNPTILNSWLLNVKTKHGFVPSKNTFLCDKHFDPASYKLVLNGPNSTEKYRKRLLPNTVPLLEWDSAPPTPELMCPENISPSSHNETVAKATQAQRRPAPEKSELTAQRAKEKIAAAKRKYNIIRRRLARARTAKASLLQKVKICEQELKRMEKHKELDPELCSSMMKLLTARGREFVKRSGAWARMWDLWARWGSSLQSASGEAT